MSTGIENVISYGTTDGYVTGRALKSNVFLEVEITSEGYPISIKTQLVGDYNLSNILCAIAVGKHFEVPVEKIVKSIEGYTPSNSRSQMLIKGTNHIILDSYNANPTSMRLAIENIAGIRSGSKILMLGGMLELGEKSLEEHQIIVELIKKYNWEKVLLVGGDFEKTHDSFLFF